MREIHTKTVFFNSKKEPIALSIIVVFEKLPNDNITVLLESTIRLSIKYEVILVVGQIEGEKEVLKSLRRNFEEKPNLVKASLILMDPKCQKNVAFGRNLGVLESSSSILLFVDDDAILFDDVRPLIDNLQTNKCQGIQPLILRFKNQGLGNVDSAGDLIRKGMFRHGSINGPMYEAYCRFEGLSLEYLPTNLHIEEVSSLKSAFMLLRKDAFLNVGGFDNTFIFNYEDVDLGWRMTCAGYKLLFVPFVRALHKGGRTTNSKKFDQSSRNRVIRFWLINMYVSNLKVTPYALWIYVLARLQRDLFLFEQANIRERVRNVPILKDLLVMNKMLIDRLGQAFLHRGLLISKFHLRGRKRLEDLARGKHFDYF